MLVIENKKSKSSSKTQNWFQWHLPVVLATWEAKAGAS